jgi:hypothetical protein
MAKSPAPFMSINPSGSIAGLLTASRWKGRPYLRLLVTPSNPQTALQSATRSILGATAKACKAVLTSFVDEAGVGSPFFTSARDSAPSGQSWVSWLQKESYNANTAILAAYALLSGTIQGYFDNTAEGIGLIEYTPTYPDGVTMTSGCQLFVLAYFASNNLSGSIKTAADTAIAGSDQGDVDDFGTAVHETTP